jgi:hypothetical protein
MGNPGQGQSGQSRLGDYHGGMKSPPDSDIVLDKDRGNADRIKAPVWNLPQDVDEFLGWLGEDPGTLQSKVAHFMTLPVATAMPGHIRQGLIERGLLSSTTLSLRPDQGDASSDTAWNRMLQNLCECHVFSGTFGLTDEYIATLDFAVHADYCPAFKAEQMHDEIREEFARA